MKKRMILITITLFVLAIGVSVYFTYRPSGLLSVEDQIPVSQSHEHAAPDGSVVHHTHTYDLTQPDTNSDKVKQEQEFETKHPIQRAWELLDLDAIKQKYQPYTVAELNEMWYQFFLGFYYPQPEALAAAEALYPRDQWLEDLMALGHPFSTFDHYQLALSRRFGITGPTREVWDTGVTEYEEDGTVDILSDCREAYLMLLKLPVDTTWDEYVEMENKFSVVRLMNVLLARELDPEVEGGFTNLDGSFLPFSPNLLNVYIDPETGRVKLMGPTLTAAEEDALVNYGIAPEGMSIVYIDGNNKPISRGKVPPRFYERNMRELAVSQALLQQQIADHEFLVELDTIPSPTKLPSDLHTQADMDRWFTALEAVHDGKLPKDLRVLREVIKELEQIRQDATQHLTPPSVPERPVSPSAVSESAGD